jgi:hypothetical protein
VTFCPGCGAESSGATFCTNCGKSIVQENVPRPVTNSDPVVNVLKSEHNTGPFQNFTPPKNNNKPLIIGASVGAGVLLVAAGIFLSGGPTALERAYESCNLASTFGASLDDDGKGLFIDMKGEDEVLGADYDDIMCAVEDLEMSPSIRSQMANTSALMGVQNASWDGISASWTYHPDRGLDISFSLD